jgi:sugar lactone lactonase YvrE
MVLDAQGNLFIADSANNRIRKVDGQGIITTIAGTGEPGFSGDGGLATAAAMNLTLPLPPGFPSLALDAAGNLFVTDLKNNRVRKIDARGIITTVAGNGQAEFSGDGGPATAAGLSRPTGLAFDSAGYLYISTTDGRVRRLAPDGIITTVVGSNPDPDGGGVAGAFVGEGGPASAAKLTPWGLAFDPDGNLLIADSNHARVRQVKDGRITTIAGGVP